MKVFLLFSLFFLVCCVFSSPVFACSCFGGEIPECVKAQYSDSVFVGKITKIEITQPRTIKNDDGSSFQVRSRWIYFDIEHPVKGISSLKQRVLTDYGSSCEIEGMKVGQRWVIFADGSENGTLSTGFCSGNYQVRDKNRIAEILSELTLPKGSQMISGLIGERFSTPGIEVTVEGQGQEFKTKTELEGFKVIVPSAGKYKVKAVVPYSAQISSYDKDVNFKTTLGENESSFEYEVELSEGECVYNIFNVLKVDLKATASIKGRVLNYLENVHQKDYVLLHQVGLSEEQTLNNYVKLERIENGEFKFEGLREGTYVILMNRENFPETDKPYLRTYLPGTNDFSSAQIIKLEQGQNISDIVFDLPKPLEQKIVTGEIVLPNGKPVTQDLRYGLGVFNFRLLNPNFIGTSKFLDSVEYENCDYSSKRFNCDDFINIDQNGKFTFKAFVGFTYLVEVEIENKNGKDKHAFVFLTVDENTKPLRIVINRNGRGDAEEFINNLKTSKQNDK